MRILSACLAASLLALPAVAQTPRQRMAEMGFAPPAAQVRRAVEAAADEPLGTRANPVRVSAPEGQRAYIARLRCGDGTAPRVGQRHNAGVGAFGFIVDVYPLDCGDAEPKQFELVMDMYHDDHVETRAPAGFTLLP